MVLIRENETLYVATVIPLDLRGFYGVPEDLGKDLGHGAETPGGFFFYRQVMDANLLGSLADLVRGQATFRFDGVAFLASHPGPVFSGRDIRWSPWESLFRSSIDRLLFSFVMGL